MSQNKINDASKDKEYFTITPQLVWALSRTPHDLALWNVIKMVAGDDSECILSTPDLATLAMMSTGKVSDCRKYLLEAGLLSGELRKDPGYPQPVWHLTIPDLWLANAEWRQEIGDKLKDRIEYKRQQKESLHEVKASPDEKGIAPDEKGIIPGEKGIIPGETKEIQKEIQTDNQKEEPVPVFPEKPAADSPAPSKLTTFKQGDDPLTVAQKCAAHREEAGNYADPLEDVLIDTAITHFSNGRAPKKSSGTYRDMANVIGEIHAAYDLASEERGKALNAVRLAIELFIAEKPQMAIYKYPSFAANYGQYLTRALNGEKTPRPVMDPGRFDEATRMTLERLKHGNG